MPPVPAREPPHRRANPVQLSNRRQPEQKLLGLSFDMLAGGEKAEAHALRAMRAVAEACSSRVDPAFNNIFIAKSA